MAAEPERVGDASDEVEDMEDEEEATGDLKQQILKRPDILAALQDSNLLMATLPPPVKRRIKALKKLQLEATHIEAKFFEEVHELECKYHLLYTPLYEKRSTVVQGLHEPNDEECDFPSDDEKEDELSSDIKNKVKIEDVSETKEPASTEEEKNNANAKGVPNFWLTIFKNVAILADMVHEHDEPILKHLIDVKVIFLKSDPMGFVLEFHFSPNEYFSNSVLTKVYEMKCVPEESDPFSFEGPEIYKCKGCTIDWKKNKNVTVKTIKKKQKHKSRGSVRTITKTIQNDSFFNFFAPPIMPEDPDAEVDEDTQSLLTTDFEIGHYIRERIVPRAVLYFTGEALEDEEEDFDDLEDEEDDDEEEDDDDEGEEGDPDFDPKNPRLPKSKKNGNPAECKQQ